ncbi:MAG: electron transport complex subunit RsxC [Pseudomonadota bacterium]|nr:electron transport complex subunit RsxC [Pseudomonadota bacterium]
MMILDSRQLYPMTGGIQLNTHRGTALESAPLNLPRPSKLTFELKTKYARFVPAVKEGEEIQAGQIIARHIQRLNKLVIRSHFAGRVMKVAPDTIQLETLEQSPQTAQTLKQAQSLQELSNMIADAGILGLGGAEFPTFAKLGKYIQTLIINGIECEPMLTADACLMTHYAEELLPGIEALQQHLPLSKVIIAIESDKPLAVEQLKQALHSQDVQLAVIPTQYPAGGSRQLFEQLYGYRLGPQERLKDRHIMSINIQTLHAIGQALAGKPMTQRLVTLAGTALQMPANYWIPLGTPIKHLLNTLNITQDVEIIRGGPLMGVQSTPTDTIQAGTSAVLFNLPQAQQQEKPCIECGDCLAPCPEALLPQTFVHYTQGNPTGSPEADEALTALNINACIECGLCDLVCPSHIPMSKQFAQAKKRIAEATEKHQRAEAARLKYEARQARLAQPKKANPMPVKAATARPRPTVARRTQSPATKFKSALAKAQRLAREAQAALAQAEKKQLDEETLQVYRDRVAQMQAKAEKAQADYAAAQAKE